MIYHFPFVVGFDWDEGNNNKNFQKYRISNSECEQIFFNEPLIILDDAKHLQKECRHAAFGFTDENKKLTVIFTMRSNLIRVISARTMNKKKERSMKNLSKKIPKFKNEDEERAFWDIHSPLDYFDVESAKSVSFPALKPSLKSISIRLPENMLEALKVLANKWDVPYQSLIKIFLARQIEQEKAILHAKPSRSKKKMSTLKHVERKRSRIF